MQYPLLTTSLLEENIAAPIARMAVRMRIKSIDSEDDEYEIDSVDDMMERIRNNDQTNEYSGSNSIYSQRYRQIHVILSLFQFLLESSKNYFSYTQICIQDHVN